MAGWQCKKKNEGQISLKRNDFNEMVGWQWKKKKNLLPLSNKVY